MWEEGDDRILSVESIAHSSSSSSSSTVSRVPINYRHMSISGGEFRVGFFISFVVLCLPIFACVEQDSYRHRDPFLSFYSYIFG